MDHNESKRIKRDIQELRQQISTIGPFMRGSVVNLGSGSRAKQPYFSVNKDKKTKIIYLGKAREARARQYSANYHQLMGILDEITLLTMELVKANIDLEDGNLS